MNTLKTIGLMNTLKTIGLFAVCAVLGIIRFQTTSHALSPTGSYEAFAHLFVGGLIGAWLISRENLYGLLALGMSAIEIIAFLTT